MDSESLNLFFEKTSFKQKKGNLLIVVLMAKHCWLEDVYHLFKLKWSLIGRRNTDQALKVKVGEHEVNTYYHAPKEVINCLKGDYRIKAQKAISFFFEGCKRKLLLLKIS